MSNPPEIKCQPPCVHTAADFTSVRSFLASLAPDLRQEILLTADDGEYQLSFHSAPWLLFLL